MMILQCPACSAQYRLQIAQVPPQGRKVKCVKCAHIWHAQADEFIEELAEPTQIIQNNQAAAMGDYRTAVEQPMQQPIPQPTADILPMNRAEAEATENNLAANVEAETREYPRVKPAIDPDREATPRFVGKKVERKKGSGLLSFFVVVMITGAVITGLVLGRVQIVQHWEAASLFYDVIGLHVPVVGEGLRFENIRTTYDKDVEGRKIILLQGEIKNLSKEPKTVPTVKIRPFNPQNAVLAATHVKIDHDQLKPGEMTKFTAQVPAETILDPQDRFVFSDE